MVGQGSPSTVAWFHCFAGIAGDMALGSLLDAGADLSEVLALLRPPASRGLDAFGPSPCCVPGSRRPGPWSRPTDDVVVRTHAHIVGLVEEARLPTRVTRRALDTFAVLAEVEGKLHRRPPEQVHFHEVGSHDAVIDVVGTAAALEVLGIDEVAASPVATGMGTIRSAHGFLPNPSPAVVRLLRGHPDVGSGPRRRAHHADRCRHPGRHGIELRAPPAHAHRGHRLRRRITRHRRASQLHPGGRG